MKKLIILSALSLSLAVLTAQESVHYSGKTLSNIDYHHGQLCPAIGVHNIQTMRANREHPDKSNGNGWTYNHQPMLAYWNNKFYLEYISNPVGEHIPPCQTMLQTSPDGYNWSAPEAVFPKYKLPDGLKKSGEEGETKDMYGVMHQRMGFYVSKSNRLFALGFYSFVLNEKDDPNDGNGLGRVIREIKKDGSFGPIYFIHYNPNFNENNTLYPYFTKSKDKGFVAACNELLGNKLMVQQWVEESDRNDPLISVKKPYKAFCFYHLPDNRVVGLWKHGLTMIIDDVNKPWPQDARRAPGVVTSNAKIWGQRTSDGKYATVYNPSEYRWPLAVSVSQDGLDYTNLLLVHGEITPMRYGGNYKSYGPQYTRGIVEGNGTPPDGNMWVTYSVNKEDIWVSSIPVPVTDSELQPVNDNFAQMPVGHELDKWNIYSPVMAPVKIEQTDKFGKCLALKDWDKFDFAKVERLFPEAKQMTAEFSVVPMQNDKGTLQIEFLDEKGTAPIRITFDADGAIITKTGSRYSTVMKYEPGETYNVKVKLDVTTRSYTIDVNGKGGTRIFFAPVASVKRIQFRTGDIRRFPTPDTPADQTYDVPNAGDSDPMSVYYIKGLKTEKN
ncbi:MAG: six-hairpin glycosidase [Bacteroidota bacterium]|nr:six-hairpin glycosidase [Bacteroidota bacterium]